MRKTLLLSFIVLCATWVSAQSSSSQNPTSSSSQAASSGTQTTVAGCLSGSNGNYTLTDQSGTSYQLSGDTASLKDHVGHEISVTGTRNSSTAAATGSSGDQSSSGATTSPNKIDVSSFKHISSSCPSSH